MAFIKNAMIVVTISLAAAVNTLAEGQNSGDSGGKYSWQKPQSKVLPNGDLEWTPQPFVFEKGDSVRYIDYEAGDDSKEGTSKEQAWKHHPWDANAIGKAKECKGIHTYVFKRGVAYRGTLTATESGKPDNPIRLTSDPSWGTGEASLLGSERLDKGWERCKAGQVAGMPEIEKVWYRELPPGVPASELWEIGKDGPVRIPIARTPNWTITDLNDPQKEFWAFTGATKTKGEGFWVYDTVHLKGFPDITGATLWSEWNGNMGTLYETTIKQFDSVAGKFMRVSIKGNPADQAAGNRYYLENLPLFLDSPGEYWVERKGETATAEGDEESAEEPATQNAAEKPDKTIRQIYLRLPGDRDPNGIHLEAAARIWTINIVDQSCIRISGLRFAFGAVGNKKCYPRFYMAPTSVRLVGTCIGINVKNCHFEHTSGVITGFTRMDQKFTELYMSDIAKPWKKDLIDDIAITDNDVLWTDLGQTISFYDGKGVGRILDLPFGALGTISILRNRMRWIGGRQRNGPYDNISAITVKGARVAEIAGNDIQHCFGTGIFTKGGKDRACISEVPLIRILIHHNRVVDTVLATNDYGGLSPWQGGPNYVYNNVVGNAVGYKSASTVDPKVNATVAYHIYLDGTFKSYTFNNVAWGRSNDPKDTHRNLGGYFTVGGFMNNVFNNTFYRFYWGICGNSGNRACYLGNIVDDMSGVFFHQNKSNDISLRGGGDTGESGSRGFPTVAYGRNVFFGKPEKFGDIGAGSSPNLENLRASLDKASVIMSELGAMATDDPLTDPAKGDFRPKADSPGKGKGVKFFVPWGLSATVGEWNFYLHPKKTEIVMGENFYMTADFLDRWMYEFLPRNDLKFPGATANDYVRGDLEDWINGAMHFDGKTRYGVLADAMLKNDFEVKGVSIVKGKVERQGNTVFKGADRRTVDVGPCNLLIEAFFRTEKGHAGSTLASKAALAGYLLGIDSQGHACLTLKVEGKAAVTLAGKTAVNDGAWHHVIAEVDRAAKRATIYVDGKIDGDAKDIALDPATSLGNSADFLVGKGPEGGFFAGDLDFLRICRGTLADAKTTIEEIYAWETNGPFLRDFNGTRPADGKRDAGAIQGK